MVIQKLKELTIDKFIVREEEKVGGGFIYRLSRNIVRGHAIWIGPNFRVVLPYGFIAVASTFLTATSFANFYLHFEDVNWFKSLLDLTMTIGTMLLCVMHISNEEDIDNLSMEIDQWWPYRHLGDEKIVVQSDIQKKLSFVIRYFFSFMNFIVSFYIILPLVRFFYKGNMDPSDLRVVEGLSEAPWVYVEIFFGVITVYVAMANCSNVVIIYVAFSFTESAQLKLAGIAFQSITRRVLKILEDENVGIDDSSYNRFEKMVHEEIKSCAMHYQAIYRQTKRMYKNFMILTNHCYYVGCFAFIALGVLVIKERQNRLLLVQVSGMVSAVLCVQFLYSYTNDSLMDEVENFRFTVYTSEWYNMPATSKKTVHIMETMLMYPPKFTTLLGSDATIEFFSKVVNAGYCYVTTILSMDTIVV